MRTKWFGNVMHGYDSKTRSHYITVAVDALDDIARTIEVAPGVSIDFLATGEVLAVEILEPAPKFDKIQVAQTDPFFGFAAGELPLRTHPADKCSGEFCCIHNPSDHHMKDWPLLWRADRGMMERTCPDGWGHPDPDDVAHHKRTHPDEDDYYSVHGCDGCCFEPTQGDQA